MNSLKTSIKLSLLVLCTACAFGCSYTSGKGCCGSHDKTAQCQKGECTEHHCAKCSGHHGEAVHNAEKTQLPGGACHQSK
jgi:hypothetical protein